jgi:hypothetical protein
MEMFQPRGEEGQEKEVTGWRLQKLLRQKEWDPKKKFRKPADMPVSGPGMFVCSFQDIDQIVLSKFLIDYIALRISFIHFRVI